MRFDRFHIFAFDRFLIFAFWPFLHFAFSHFCVFTVFTLSRFTGFTFLCFDRFQIFVFWPFSLFCFFTVCQSDGPWRSSQSEMLAHLKIITHLIVFPTTWQSTKHEQPPKYKIFQIYSIFCWIVISRKIWRLAKLVAVTPCYRGRTVARTVRRTVVWWTKRKGFSQCLPVCWCAKRI